MIRHCVCVVFDAGVICCIFIIGVVGVTSVVGVICIVFSGWFSKYPLVGPRKQIDVLEVRQQTSFWTSPSWPKPPIGKSYVVFFPLKVCFLCLLLSPKDYHGC
jgi:hypothetical protein